MTEKSREDGFTLVELLVVMVILATLAGIALPVLLGSRQRAYDAAMKSDLRNAVTAEAAFTADHAAYTTRLDDLANEGYLASKGVTPVHVRLVGDSYVLCVKHEAAAAWLVYDGSSGETSPSASDCT